MSKYTTGEIAKLCDVSVRTVQFYDAKGLLPPTELTEGGRRLYSEEDLKKLRLICVLKALGLPLDSIRDILGSQTPDKVLLLLLEEQSKRIENEIRERQRQKEAIRTVRESIRSGGTIPVDSRNGIERMMNEKKKLRKAHVLMLIVGIAMDIIEIGTIFLWIFKGIWLPFAVGLPVAVLLGCLSTRLYYRASVYLCPECNTKFRPSLRDFLFSRHTPKTRKLKCPNCGYAGPCVEVGSDEVADRG